MVTDMFGLSVPQLCLVGAAVSALVVAAGFLVFATPPRRRRDTEGSAERGDKE